MAAGGGRYVVRSVVRALDVVIALSEQERPASLAGLSTLVGLTPATTLRMLESLRARDLVRRNKAGDYEVGAGAFRVGAAFLRAASVYRDAQGLAEELAGRVNETANVGVLDHGQVLYIAIAHAQRELAIRGTVGQRHPAHCTALGKALLAHRPWSQVVRVLEAYPPELAASDGHFDRAAFREALTVAARQGFAVDYQERSPGVVCIAAPIRDHTDRVVAALSLSGPAVRIPPEWVSDLSDVVVGLAGEASERLGASTVVIDIGSRRVRA